MINLYNFSVACIFADEINDTPVEEVRLTIPITDDPTIPALTFRTWFIGVTLCCTLAFLNRMFDYRQNRLYISTDCIQILILPIGKLMARFLPTKRIRVFGTKWAFSLNPGPFSLKEHVLITIFANIGEDAPYPTSIMTVMKAYFHRKFDLWTALTMSFISQMVGYGFIGFLVKPLVENPIMWWPEIMVIVSLYRTLHEGETRSKGQLTRIQFFLLAVVANFAYYIIPNYFFPYITALSFICWIWKDSVTAQQIGSSRNGLGLGSFTIDYTTVATYLSNPLATPTDTIINTMIGFVMMLYIFTPILYWTNAFNAKRFPIFSSDAFDADGQTYNVSRVLKKDTFVVDRQAFENYSKVYLSSYYVISYVFGNMLGTATLSYVVIHYGRSIWDQVKEAFGKRHNRGDVHNRLMSKYKTVPIWWYHTILILALIPALLISIFSNQFQLPLWGVLVAIGSSLIFTIPAAVMQATANVAVLPNDLLYLLMMYAFTGKPLALLTYGSYTTFPVFQAIYFLRDLKLAHYMKIPPRSMFTVQVVSTLLSASTNVGATWWILTTVENICEVGKLPKGSPWTCPGEKVFYNSIVQSSVIGPAQLFVPYGHYGWTYIFYGVGIFLPIITWKLSQISSWRWIKLINIPVLLSASSLVPPATPSYVYTWAAIGIFFNNYLFNKYKQWWAKYNYVLSAGLNIGPAFITLLMYFALNRQQIYGTDWWGMTYDDHCPLATCPTAPGIVVEGCPVLH
ncbi:hypothetical protein ACLOJK_016011 [Asimina triloba]